MRFGMEARLNEGQVKVLKKLGKTLGKVVRERW